MGINTSLHVVERTTLTVSPLRGEKPCALDRSSIDRIKYISQTLSIHEVNINFTLRINYFLN